MPPQSNFVKFALSGAELLIGGLGWRETRFSIDSRQLLNLGVSSFTKDSRKMDRDGVRVAAERETENDELAVVIRRESWETKLKFQDIRFRI